MSSTVLLQLVFSILLPVSFGQVYLTSPWLLGRYYSAAYAPPPRPVYSAPYAYAAAPAPIPPPPPPPPPAYAPAFAHSMYAAPGLAPVPAPAMYAPYAPTPMAAPFSIPMMAAAMPPPALTPTFIPAYAPFARTAYFIGSRKGKSTSEVDDVEKEKKKSED